MSTTRESMMRRKTKRRNFEDIDKISQLPDDLLVKILLFLPTNIAVSTSILSKRWEFLWMLLPKLEYECVGSYSDYDYKKKLKRFIDLNLPLHKASIESLRLKFNGPFKTVKPKDIEQWVAIALSHCIRELSLAFCSWKDRPATLPSSFYICKSLVILKLKDEIFVDVPRMACLLSLKTLFLQRVIYSNENSLHNLLSSCPVLEDLVFERGEFDYFGTRVNVPTLQRLTVMISRTYTCSVDLVVITPSLKYFKVKENKGEHSDDEGDHSDENNYFFYSENMPNLEEVDIESIYPGIDKFVRSIASVKRLSLCVRVNTHEALYRQGIFFNQLKHLTLCQCDPNWSKLLVQLLNDSPNLREIEVYQHDDHQESNLDPLVCWENELNRVPECLLSSLETFKWTWIYGWQKEIDLLKYILKNACCLKTAIILFQPEQETEDTREMMIQELLLSSRGSTTCQFVFDFEDLTSVGVF